MQRVDTLILGGGLTGLSGAYHLDRQAAATGDLRLGDWLLVERDARLGGLTRTEVVDGYHFDHTGHWLHLRYPEMQQFVADVMGDQMLRVARRSRIWSHGVLTQFPFQQNLHGLPLEVVHECVQAAIEASLAEARGEHVPVHNFAEFCVQRFGKGITDRFMVPYNTKLWGCPPEEITADWCARFLPKPNLSQIVAGALGIVDETAGYNASFLYPKAGGIESFAKAIAARLPSAKVRLNTVPVRIDLAARTAGLSDGTTVSFRRVLSSVPLPDLYAIVADVPDALRERVGQLRCTSLRYMNYGIARPGVLDDIQWLYVPEPRYPFYRIGSFSNAVASLAPAGKSSLYVEVAANCPDSDGDVQLQVRQFLRAQGWLESDDQIEVQDVRHIRYGYVVFDRPYFGARADLLGHLESRGLASRGRYGGWVYSSMEDAMWEGYQFARAAEFE
ncbi:MAG: FAD-dependent oxidoreductase [Deltaproteobacteria bacterium]|nr:FAD-dependent oxidoreductase [Deltaproteobacteria bacterium]